MVSLAIVTSESACITFYHNQEGDARRRSDRVVKR